MTIMESSTVLLGWQPSGRLRQLLRNACDLQGLAARDLAAAGVFPDDSPRSTVARILSGQSSQRVSSRFVPACTTWLAQVAGCKEEDVTEYLDSGRTDQVGIQELSAQRVFPHTALQLMEFAAELKRLEANSTECWMLTDIPTASLLPERVMQRIYRWETCTTSKPFHDFRIELDFGRRRWTKLEQEIEQKPLSAGVIFTRTGLGKLFSSAGECALNAEEKDLLIETILDRMEIHNLQVGLVDDRPGKSAAALRPLLDRFPTRAVFDQGVSIRRTADGLVRVQYVSTSSPAQAAVVKADLDAIQFAKQKAVLDSKVVSEWLLEQASENSWRNIRMRMDANF